jgi:hypothetical protein
VAAPPAALATPEAAAPTPDGGAIDTDQSAVGACKHPTLGALRVSKGPDGILLDKDSKNIPMRRLLYAIYDGTDATGNVHNVELVFDDAGHVVALRYSNGGTGPITFDKMEK